MKHCVLTLLMAATVVSAQYKLEPAGDAPSELAPSIAAALQAPGTKIVETDGSVLADVWVRSAMPQGERSQEMEVTFPTVPHGSLLGALRFTKRGSDRRGQQLKPGVYTLRYSRYPVDGAHQGVAPQRDFLIMLRAEDDKDPAKLYTYEELMESAKLASGTPHPAILSLAPPLDGAPVPGFVKEGNHDWMLNLRIGQTPVGIIMVGTAE